MAGYRVKDRADLPGIQFVMTLPRPRFAEVARCSVDRFRHVAQMLLGVEAVDDLEGTGKVLLRKVSDRCSAIAEDGTSWSTVETTAAGFPEDALGEP